MKKTRGQRRLSLLLALLLCLTLVPPARADEGSDSPGPSVTITTASPLQTQVGQGPTLTVETKPTAGQAVAWRSSDEAVVTVDNYSRILTAHKPGEADVYAFLQANPQTESEALHVVVSGIAVPEDALDIQENETINLQDLAIRDKWCKGDANAYTLTATSRDISIVEVTGTSSITGLREGSATLDLRVYGENGSYTQTLQVNVTPDKNTVINAGSITTNSTLSFSDLNIPGKLGNLTVEYATGLFVPTDQGTLYYDYRSEAEPGAGVGQSQTYYLSPGPGQRGLLDVTFVPKPGYPGGDVTITFNAAVEGGRQYSCKIELTIQGSSGNDGSQAGGISLQTNYNTAAHFDSIEFGAVCREKLGAQLDYVLFSQPPERQGALYTNYSSAESYGSLVDIRRQYSRRELDDVWFVPAPGFSNGTVTVYYTGFGANGKSYSGQVLIKVGQEDPIATGGLSYNTSPGVAARFDEDDFDAYCWDLLNREQALSAIRFDSLPAGSDGVLYYDYRSSGNPGTPADAGTVYYYGSRTPRIDRLAFVPAEDFTGSLKLPFTGWTMDGTSFSGNVEINVRGSASSAGDIYYYCAPGRSVSFHSSDFTSLSREMTGRTLDYIRFRGLPDTSEGSLYSGGVRVAATNTIYTSGGINRLSFRASSSFSGLVNIPFEGRSTGGDAFTGVITIGSGSTGSTGSSGSESAGSGSSGNLNGENVTARYSTRTAPVRFYASDLAQSGYGLSSVRFTSLPYSSAGYLYDQYISPTQHGQQSSTGTLYQASGSGLISDLTFVPRAGYSGTVILPYTGTNSSGSTFKGQVEITVLPTYSSSYFSDMAGYGSAQLAAVDFLYDHNITRGLIAGQYGPEVPLRRGDFALMLYQAFEFSPTSYVGSFADVPSDAYYAPAVGTLYARGVVSGVGNGYYDPDNTLTRQDAVCMIQRAMQSVGWSAGDGYVSALAGYADSGSVSGYAQGAMAMAVQRGYLPATAGRLNPQQPLTRVDMAEMLHRALTY